MGGYGSGAAPRHDLVERYACLDVNKLHRDGAFTGTIGTAEFTWQGDAFELTIAATDKGLILTHDVDEQSKIGYRVPVEWTACSLRTRLALRPSAPATDLPAFCAHYLSFGVSHVQNQRAAPSVREADRHGGTFAFFDFLARHVADPDGFLGRCASSFVGGRRSIAISRREDILATLRPEGPYWYCME